VSPILGIIASSKFAAAGDFESIATASVGSGGVADVEFTSIPATYTHLQLRVLSRTTRSGQNFNNVALQINSDTGANYNAHLLRGDGSSAISDNDVSASSLIFNAQAAADATASVMGAFVMDILDYANTNKYKTVRSLFGVDNNGSGLVGLMSGAWRSTSAITSIKLFSVASGNLAQYSHFALYGIKGA